MKSFSKATDTSLTEEMIILMLPRLWTEVPLARGTHGDTQLWLEITGYSEWHAVQSTKIALAPKTDLLR